MICPAISRVVGACFNACADALDVAGIGHIDPGARVSEDHGLKRIDRRVESFIILIGRVKAR
jgi:hypothetical protein